jgi:Spy/CpxP family protein refolding chaperone
MPKQSNKYRGSVHETCKKESNIKFKEKDMKKLISSLVFAVFFVCAAGYVARAEQGDGQVAKSGPPCMMMERGGGPGMNSEMGGGPMDGGPDFSGPGGTNEAFGPGGPGFGPGFGGPHPGCPMAMMGGLDIGMMLDNTELQKELGITDDQKAKLKSIATDSMRKSIRSEADIKILHIDLKELMDAPKPDKAKIDKKIDEISAAMAAQMKIGIHVMIDSRNVLTPEQLEKMEGMSEKMMREGMKGMLEGGEEKGMKCHKMGRDETGMDKGDYKGK